MVAYVNAFLAFANFAGFIILATGGSLVSSSISLTFGIIFTVRTVKFLREAKLERQPNYGANII